MELNPMKLSMASFNSVSTNGGEKIMITDIDYTDRLEKNIKNLQNMALDINNHTREDENVKKTEWIQQNKANPHEETAKNACWPLWGT